MCPINAISVAFVPVAIIVLPFFLISEFSQNMRKRVKNYFSKSNLEDTKNIIPSDNDEIPKN